MNIKVPRTLCKIAPLAPILVHRPRYDFKTEVVDWFKSLDEAYSITERIYFNGSDMIVDLEAVIENDDVAVQFKLTWL
jgi:hypothetical protein